MKWRFILLNYFIKVWMSPETKLWIYLNICACYLENASLNALIWQSESWGSSITWRGRAPGAGWQWPANRDYIVTVINRLYLSVHSLRYRRRGLYSFRHGTGISFIDSLRLIMFELIVWLWCCQLSAVRPHSSCQCDRYRLLSVQTLAPASHSRVWCQPQQGSAVLMLR